MSDIVVVDASLAVKWVLKEPHSTEALALLQMWEGLGIRMVAPAVLVFEVANAVFRRFVRGELTLDAARDRVDAFLKLSPELDLHQSMHRRALDLAEQFGRPTVYDTHYLALAERYGCECWTADERLWNATRAKLAWVRWIGEYSPAQT